MGISLSKGLGSLEGLCGPGLQQAGICEQRREWVRLNAQGNSFVSWYGKGRRQNWCTPRALFERLHEEYCFTLDGASEPGNGLLARSATLEQPLPWAGERVFCNPPWSNIAPFLELAPAAELAVFLVPARTNARWFHRALHLGAVPRFFLGKPKFVGALHTSPVDCVYLVFQKQRDWLND